MTENLKEIKINTNIQQTSEEMNYEEIINSYFNFFINLEETNENGDKFNIDWIYLKKKEDDLILFYLNQGTPFSLTDRPTIINKILKKTTPNGSYVEKNIETYQDNFVNNISKFYPNTGKILNKNDIQNIIEIITSENKIYNNELFNLLSEKIVNIIEKYNDNVSLVYDNIILILNDFDCSKYLPIMKAYYIAIKIIYINNKNYYFSNNFQYLLILYYIILSFCVSSTQLLKRVVGTVTYDVMPGTQKSINEITNEETSYYTLIGILIDNITTNIFKIFTLNKYNFATENDYNISKITEKNLKNLYLIPDLLPQNEILLNSLSKGLKTITSFIRPTKISGGKRKSIKVLNQTNKKRTLKNKKYKGGFGVAGLTLGALYYYFGTYGTNMLGLFTGYGSDRAKLTFVKNLLNEIKNNEPIINSIVYKYIFKISNPWSNNYCNKGNDTNISNNFATRSIKKTMDSECLEEQEKNKKLIVNSIENDEYAILKLINKNLKQKNIDYKSCNIDSLKYILENNVNNGLILNNNISFFVNILNVYGNIYISKCTNITKFDFSEYNEENYNEAFDSLYQCFGSKTSLQNAPYFEITNKQNHDLRLQIIVKLVDILREQKINDWNKDTKKIKCSQNKTSLSNFIKNKFIEIFKEFNISV